tara:strand:+ start:65 stop:265 length:201 start_codon:yes stop_codon:yes gene_type:complete
MKKWPMARCMFVAFAHREIVGQRVTRLGNGVSYLHAPLSALATMLLPRIHADPLRTVVEYSKSGRV